MGIDEHLKGKLILIVDDEPDILDSLEDMLYMCEVHRAGDFDSAIKYLRNNEYDGVVLDIMGVNGFELLKEAVSLGYPAIMLTAHALTPEALKKSIELGAVAFVPKENITDVPLFLKDVVVSGGKPNWQNTFSRAGAIFNRRFGPAWREKESVFSKIIEDLKNEMK